MRVAVPAGFFSNELVAASLCDAPFPPLKGLRCGASRSEAATICENLCNLWLN
jgi:hypothetical protein